MSYFLIALFPFVINAVNINKYCPGNRNCACNYWTLRYGDEIRDSVCTQPSDWMGFWPYDRKSQGGTSKKSGSTIASTPSTPSVNGSTIADNKDNKTVRYTVLADNCELVGADQNEMSCKSKGQVTL